MPKAITVDDSEIREALSECVSTIVRAVRVALERTAPELSADISDRHRARRRRCLTEKPGQANPGRNGVAGMRR